MRKYNDKTKRTMIIIGAIFAIFIIIFSLFLNRYNKVKTTAYRVATGAVLFDNEQNKITTKDESTMRIKWAGDYYLNYNEENINLGNHSIIYNSGTGDISLYGKFYEVNKDGKVNNLKDENIIKNSVKSKFYKLADRKYLIIDRTIEASNSSFVTSNYLIINLDKSGNATLLNNKVSLKTITPTKIRTSSYIFDIANETINFGDEDIDLKKIIGSTNKYDKDYNINEEKNDKDTQENGGSGSGNGEGSGEGDGSGSGSGSGGGSGNGGGGNSGANGSENSINGFSNDGTGDGTTKESSSKYTNNYDSGISDETVDQIIKASKNTSVIRVTPNINSISVDYVAYDPNNEYKSVYVEVENTTTGQSRVVYMSKTDTNILINDLQPNNYYNLTFKYNNTDNGQIKANIFDTFGTYTKIPQMILSVPKVIDNKVYYRIDLDSSYNIVGGAINLLVNGQIVKSTSIPAQGTTNKIGGTNYFFDIKDLKLKRNNNTVLTLKLVLINFNTYNVNPGISYKFKY
ncbi:MAG: hypothetical protein IKF19_06815 [Bacilli bacterium]|nr:hypothetical protein [Bacilli bacterium]